MDYVYAIKCPWTNHIVYIGHSRKPHVRLNQHYSQGYYNISKYIRACRSLGKFPVIEILGSKERCAKTLESYYIKLYSMFNQANHNVMENNKNHIAAINRVIDKVDCAEAAVNEKLDIIRRLKYTFYHDSNCHRYSVHALRQILYYVNNPT